MATPTRPRYAGHRFPAETISHAIWLYFRFPLGLRMVEEMLAARGIVVSHETVRQAVGAQVRPGARKPGPPASTVPRRQVAPG
jgi:transposase-like protein